jgi:hypothetical protein
LTGKKPKKKSVDSLSRRKKIFNHEKEERERERDERNKNEKNKKNNICIVAHIVVVAKRTMMMVFYACVFRGAQSK